MIRKIIWLFLWWRILECTYKWCRHADKCVISKLLCVGCLKKWRILSIVWGKYLQSYDTGNVSDLGAIFKFWKHLQKRRQSNFGRHQQSLIMNFVWECKASSCSRASNKYMLAESLKASRCGQLPKNADFFYQIIAVLNGHLLCLLRLSSVVLNHVFTGLLFSSYFQTFVS